MGAPGLSWWSNGLYAAPARRYLRAVRRWTLAALLVLGLAGLWRAAGSGQPSPDLQVRRSARLLSLDEPDISALLDEIAEPIVSLRVGEAQFEELSRPELAHQIADVTRRRGRLVVELQQPETRREDNRATVRTVALLSESQAGDLHAEEREVQVELKRSDRWRIHRVSVGAARKHLPEARP